MWILIDVHNWYAADYYAAGPNSPTVFCNRLRDVITKIKSISEKPVTRIQLCSDSKESFRRQLDPTYKSHRRQKADDYWTIFDRLMVELAQRHIEPLERNGFEADDIIAALCWEAHHEGEQVVICSGDRDLHALLVAGEITQATKWERYGSTDVRPTWVKAATVFERYGVHPHQWIDYRCMVGDKSDGLTGCQGIGEDTAKIVLQACGTMERFWADPFKPNIQPAKRTRLVNFRKQYESVRQLVALRADCLTEEAGTEGTREDRRCDYGSSHSIQDRRLSGGGATMNVDQRIQLLDELSGDKCRCGNLKRENQTFCWKCYKSLPREMQADLYKRFGLGYEEAYAAAVKYFEERGTKS